MSNLLRAVRKDKTEEVMELLQENQDLNTKDHKGTPILHHAIENENLEVVEFLLFPPGELNYPADPNLTDAKDSPPIFKAIESNLLEAVKLLVKAGADLNYQMPKTFETALHLSISQQNTNDIARYLMSQPKIDPNTQLKGQGSALFIATYTGNFELFEELLRDPRVDLSQVDEKSNSVFHIALDVGAISVVQVLLEHMAKMEDKDKLKEFVNLQNGHGDTCLHQAIKSKRQSIYQQLLLRAEQLGLDVGMKNNKGWTAAEMVVKQKEAFVRAQKEKAERKKQRTRDKHKKQEETQLAKQAERARVKRLEAERKAQAKQYKAELEEKQRREPFLVLGVFVLFIIVLYLVFLLAEQRQKLTKDII